MKTRKTIKITELLDIANLRLASYDITQDRKAAICHIVEHFLFESNVYAGFSYNFSWNDIPVEDANKNRYSRKYYTHKKLFK